MAVPEIVKMKIKEGDTEALRRLGAAGGRESGISKRYETDKRQFVEDIKAAKLHNGLLQSQLDAGEITQATFDEQYFHLD